MILLYYLLVIWGIFAQELTLENALGAGGRSAFGSFSGSNVANRRPRPQPPKPAEESEENETEESDAEETESNEPQITDEYEGYQITPILNTANGPKINPRGQKIDKNLPRPYDLEKRSAGEKKLLIRFRQPPGGKSVQDSFTHYKITCSHPTAPAYDVVKYIRKDTLKPTDCKVRAPGQNQDCRMFYVNIEDPLLRPGILYKVIIQTMVKQVGKEGAFSFSSVLTGQSSGQQSMMRTNPPKIFDLKISKMEGAARSVDLEFSGVPTSQSGPIYNYIHIEMFAMEKNGKRVVDKKAIPIISKSAINYSNKPIEHSINFKQLTTGTEYLFEIYTISDGGAGARDDAENANINYDITMSEKETASYEVSFEGPQQVEKIGESMSDISFNFTTEEMPGIDSYRISISELLKNGTITPLHSDIIMASEPGGNVTEEHSFGDLEPGALYMIGLSSIRSELQFGNESETTYKYFRTLPFVPNPENITVTLEENLEISDVLRTASLNFDSLLEADGIFDFVGVEYTSVDTGKTVGPQYLTYESIAEEKMNFTMTELLPGAQYNLTLIVGSKYKSLDPTRSLITKMFRTKPNPPRAAKADSTRGTIHLSWHRPEGMGEISGWQYRLRYVIDDIAEWDPNKATEEEKFIPAGSGANSANSIPRRDDFLSRLISGRKYKIHLETVAGTGKNGDVQIISEPLGPLIVYTQPAQPQIEEWLQITTDHIKVMWSPPEDRLGKFERYYLNVTRRRERYSAIPYEPEHYHYAFDKNHTFHIMEITAGALYNMTLTTIVGTGDAQLESIVTNDNKRTEVNTWSAYVMHSTFRRLEWKFTSCGQIGQNGPSQDQCDAEYESTNLKKMVQVNNGVQEWLAPIRGLYRIIAAGPGYERTGGLGAKISGTFDFKQGDKLNIIVGQRGDFFGDMVVGGGGGSFVLTAKDSTPLVVAGGAGSSAPKVKPSPKANANLAQVGRDASEIGQNHGLGGIRGGAGLRGAFGTGGGAGLLEDGDVPSNVGPKDSGEAAVAVLGDGGFDRFDQTLAPGTGGKYETLEGEYSEGGFGGGGAGYKDSAGGGGGYSGGAGGPENGYSGGGGCFLKYTGGKQLAALDNEDEGYVIISLIGLPKEDPVPMELYLTLSFILGMGVAAWCGCLMAWISKCMDWVIGEDEELIQRQKRRELMVRNKQLQQEAEFDAAIHNATIKRFMEDQDEGFSSEGSFRSPRNSLRRRQSAARRKREAEERRGRSPTRRGKPERVPYRMADAGSPPPSTKPAKSIRQSFKSVISDVASVLTMSKRPDDQDLIIDEEDENVIVEEPTGHTNAAGYSIPKVRTIDDPNDVVVSYQRNYKTPRELQEVGHKAAFQKQKAEFIKAADKYGTSMFMGRTNEGNVPIMPVAKLGEETKLKAAEIRDGYAAAMLQSYSSHAKKTEPKKEIHIDVPCERLPTPPETDYDDPDYDSEEEARKKKAREEAEHKLRTRPKTTNATKDAFGVGKNILNRMQKEGWTVGPGGQLIKSTQVKPNTANQRSEAASKLANQNTLPKLKKSQQEDGEPPKKSPKLEPKPKQVQQAQPTPTKPQSKIEIPKEETENETEVEFKMETTDCESYNPVENFSIAAEMKKIQKEKAKKEKESNKKNAANDSDCAELPDHLNHNVSVFDKMRDRVAQEKAEARKKNPFASATETEQETETEFEFKEGNETETDFEAEMAQMNVQSIKPKPAAIDKIRKAGSSKGSSKGSIRSSLKDNSDLLSDMSDLSDMPTLSELTESEIDEDIKTVKELMGATIDDIPLDKRLADINLTTDDETHSELKLTDVEQSIAQNESGEETDDSDSYKYPHSMVSRMTGGTVRPGPGYNTGTLKSSLSGFSAHNSQTETDDQNILSDASTTDNSDDLPLPVPKKVTPQKLIPQPVSEPKPVQVTKPPAASINRPMAKIETPSQGSANPFANIKLKPLDHTRTAAAPKPAAPPALPSKGPVTVAKTQKDETDNDALSDASKTESISDLGDTTEQESDWPELNQPAKNVKPKSITPTAITPKTITPTPKPVINNTPVKLSPVKSSPVKPAVVPPKKIEKEPETEDDKLVTDYDDLSDTDLTLGETTDQNDSEDETQKRNTIIARHESVRSDMTSESDWNMPSNAVTIKPNSIKPKPAGSFTKQPLPMKTVSPSKPSSGKPTSNPNFEQLKPKSSKQLEDIFSDAKGDDSDDVSVLSDGMTTDDGGFNV